GFFVPNRWLNVRGRLGFHAPYVPVDAPGERAYAAGVRAIAALISRSVKPEGMAFFPPDLLAEFLQVGPDGLFEIEWVHQSIHWDIRLDGLSIPSKAVTGCIITRACINYVWEKEDPINYSWIHDVLSAPDPGDSFENLLTLKSDVKASFAPKRSTAW